MSEYKGFKYKHVDALAWTLIYPSGFKAIVTADDEDALKHMIDELENNFRRQ